MLIVSKCLTGECCRYDGGTKPDERIIKLVENGEAIAVCPEQLGGLPIPRLPAELTGDGAEVLKGNAGVVLSDGTDVTAEFIKGAYAALETAKACGADRAVLKARSPSCGKGVIYDGSFTCGLKRGDGVTAALFAANGIEVENI